MLELFRHEYFLGCAAVIPNQVSSTMTVLPAKSHLTRLALLASGVLLIAAPSFAAAPPHSGVWASECVATDNPNQSIRESLVLGKRDAFVFTREKYNAPDCSGHLLANEEARGTYQLVSSDLNQAQQQLQLSLLNADVPRETSVHISVYGEALWLVGNEQLLTSTRGYAASHWTRLFQRQSMNYWEAKKP